MSINQDLLNACKEMIQCIADYNSGMDEEVSGWLYHWQRIVDKAEGRE